MTQYLCMIVAGSLFFSTISIAQTEWRMRSGNVGRTSFIRAETQLKPPLKLIKAFPTIRAGLLAATAQEVFVAVSDRTPNSCSAYNLLSGDFLWSAEVPNSGGGMNFTPAVLNSLVLLGGQGGTGLVAVDRATGVQRWLKPIKSLYDRAPVVENERIYIIGDSLYCLAAADGRTYWSYPINKQGTPALDAATVYATDYSELVALDKGTGALKWKVPNDGFWMLAVDDDFVYTYSDSTLHARRKSDGTPAWSYMFRPGEPGRNDNPVSVSETRVILEKDMPATNTGELVGLEKGTGKFVWRRSIPTYMVEAATIANGVAYFTDYRYGQLWALDERDGSVIFIDSSVYYAGQPVIADHKLIVGSSTAVRVFATAPVNAVESGEPPSGPAGRPTVSPNPCTAETWIAFRLDREGSVLLRIFDALGRRIETLIDDVRGRGDLRLSWSPALLPAGVYHYLLSTPEGTVSGKILHVN